MGALGFGWVLWCAALAGCLAAPRDNVTPGQTRHEAPEILEDELENQANILTQMLGDYDKVKALAEGSDCGCKCVVRPLSRSVCRHIEEGTAKAEDFYTVETVTVGQGCKCACIAPPSALNPCEGDFRLKKLQNAEKGGVKLSAIIELLEGAFYGMDLLKLHSVTAKLLKRVEQIERAVSENQIKEAIAKTSQKIQKTEDIKHQGGEKEFLKVLGDTAAAFVNKEAGFFKRADAKDPVQEKYEHKFVGKGELAGAQLVKKAEAHKEVRNGGTLTQHKAGPRGSIIRGITFYKSSTVDEADTEEKYAEILSGDGSIDLLIEDQLLLPNSPKLRTIKMTQTATSPILSLGPETKGTSRILSTTTSSPDPENETSSSSSAPAPYIHTVTVTDNQEISTEHTSHITEAPPTALYTEITAIPISTGASSTNAPTTIPTVHTPPAPSPPPAATGSTSRPTVSNPKYDIRWSQSPPTGKSVKETRANPASTGLCKDTLASISEPVTHNTYGLSEGAWMKDPKAQDDRIYVTNDYYGNNLLEFRNIEAFKQGHISNSFKLPYNWIGTGHVVFNGAFYYNRAFSHDIIKFDLRMRHVTAWAELHDAAFVGDESTPRRWSGHSDVDFAVDESGLWVIYPALDEEAFYQEVVMLSQLNPADLSIQKETSWRTGLRKDFYGNCFMVCGVLYAVDKYNQLNANVSYAFDTHTNTQTIPSLPFTNNYTYTTQIDYNPKDRVLFAWDNGHQVTYNVMFAY